eukprot:m.90431 g.90431  ORF g.90431 m.90431 type:complete len:122 (-) comp16455_c0_seq13:360-725(-)
MKRKSGISLEHSIVITLRTITADVGSLSFVVMYARKLDGPRSIATLTSANKLPMEKRSENFLALSTINGAIISDKERQKIESVANPTNASTRCFLDNDGIIGSFSTSDSANHLDQFKNVGR